MQIRTKETVQQTLSKYRWDDLENWHQFGHRESDTFSRSVYKKGNLIITQKKWQDGQGICIETPNYTLYVGTGYHLNYFDTDKQTQYYSLSVATTMGEKKIYQSVVDEAGFKDIQGDRQQLLNLIENLPNQYFVLDVDEKAQHISTLWMNPRRSCIPRHHSISMGKGERE